MLQCVIDSSPINNATNQGHCVSTLPLNCMSPTAPYSLLYAQQHAYDLMAAVNGLSLGTNMWHAGEGFCCLMEDVQYEKSRLRGLLQLREMEIEAERNKYNNAVAYCEWHIASLRRNLHSQMSQVA